MILQNYFLAKKQKIIKNYMRYVQGLVELKIHKNKDEKTHSKQNTKNYID